MQLHDVSEIVAASEFKVFTDALAAGGIVKAICPPGGAKFTRKEIDAYTAFAGELGAKGLAWCKLENGAAAGGVAKFFTADMPGTASRSRSAPRTATSCSSWPTSRRRSTRPLRPSASRLGKDLKLYDEDQFAWCWVTDFPAAGVERGGEALDGHAPPVHLARGRRTWTSWRADPGAVRRGRTTSSATAWSWAAGRSVSTRRSIQQRVFAVLGIGEEEAQEKFGFLLDALQYGAPPHGGIALGLDRIGMMMIGGQSLRDVIAFPKTQRGICPLTGAPSTVDERQLAELDLKIIAPPKK